MNPWKDILLSDYENHMSLESVQQLQVLNKLMKQQFYTYDIDSIMILGVAGGNGLEHIDPKKIEKVYGVATFYSQFALTPKGKYKISVCLGTACYVKGAQDVLDRICHVLGIGPDECTEDGKFSIEACRCIGACGLAPVLTINEDVYGRLEKTDVDDILKKYMD